MARKRIGFSIVGDAIAPVFDVSRNLRVYEMEVSRPFDFAAMSRYDVCLDGNYFERAAILKGIGVQLIVCGAISKEFEAILTAIGIKIIPFVSGNIHEILWRIVSGHRLVKRFFMPGIKPKNKKEKRR